MGCHISLTKRRAQVIVLFDAWQQRQAESVDARFTDGTIEIFHKGKRIASHVRSRAHKHTTIPEHMPSSHRHADQTERYYLTHCRRLGANKLFVRGRDAPAVRFAVWAPNARNVELVRSRLAGENNSEGGYIWDDGRGVSAVIPMHRDQDGVWSTDLADSPDLVDFRPCDHTLYMFRITKDDGSIAYRTDLYSRCQIGSGDVDPAHAGWSGRRQDLDGTKSCALPEGTRR